MKNAKRIIAMLLAMLFVLSLAACGTFSPPVNTDTGSDNTDTDTGNETPDKTVEFSEEAFTVSLRYRGQEYIPENETIVYWTKTDGKGGFSSCPIYKNGVAGIEAGVDGVEKGLDGDYRVTISYVPEGIAYNPNGYIATNDNRHIVIDLYDVQKTTGKGRDEYNCISLTKPAVYQVKLNSATHKVFFEFRPTTEGMYTVESWMDTTAEMYNPYCHTYTGTFAVKYPGEVVDGGGAEGVYTKNFLNGIDVSEDMIGNVLTFAISADSKTGQYPVTVTFAVQLNGGFPTNNKGDADMYVMQEDASTYLSAQKEYGADYQLVGAETTIPGREGAYMFDETMYQLWKKEDGGDNLYHLYDKEAYPETNGYGPILYAYITMPHRFVDTAFTGIEYHGNKCLTVTFKDGSRINYKHFIEGYNALATRNESNFNGGSYYCDEYCPCHLGEDYGLACTSDCPDEFCKNTCRHIEPENIGFGGIRQYANSDGLVAVTEEVKIFLFNLSINQRYFADGEGWVESNDVIEIDSNDASQWLFACAYYKKIN